MKRSHTGIAAREGQPRWKYDHAVDPDPRLKICLTCSRSVMYVRKTYGPHGRAGHWQHVGDGLTQYRSWHLGTRGSPR